MARDHGAVPQEIELDAIESNNTTGSGSSNEVNIVLNPLPLRSRLSSV